MSFTRVVSRLNVAPIGPDARKFGRVKVEMTECSLGNVLDISGGGVRIHTPKKHRLKNGQVIDIMISSTQGSTPVRARVVWVVKRSWRNFEIGLEFLGLTGQSRAVLNQIGRSCANNEYINSQVRADTRRAAS